MKKVCSDRIWKSPYKKKKIWSEFLVNIIKIEIDTIYQKKMYQVIIQIRSWTSQFRFDPIFCLLGVRRLLLLNLHFLSLLLMIFVLIFVARLIIPRLRFLRFDLVILHWLVVHWVQMIEVLRSVSLLLMIFVLSVVARLIIPRLRFLRFDLGILHWLVVHWVQMIEVLRSVFLFEFPNIDRNLFGVWNFRILKSFSHFFWIVLSIDNFLDETFWISWNAGLFTFSWRAFFSFFFLILEFLFNYVPIKQCFVFFKQDSLSVFDHFNSFIERVVLEYLFKMFKFFMSSWLVKIIWQMIIMILIFKEVFSWAVIVKTKFGLLSKLV